MTYPDPVSASDEFVDYLATIVPERRIQVLLPVSVVNLLVTAAAVLYFGL